MRFKSYRVRAGEGPELDLLCGSRFARGGAAFEPRLYFQHGHGFVIWPLDGDDLVLALGQIPSLFKRFFFRRAFPGYHLMFQLVIDIADNPPHEKTPSCRYSDAFHAARLAEPSDLRRRNVAPRRLCA